MLAEPLALPGREAMLLSVPFVQYGNACSVGPGDPACTSDHRLPCDPMDAAHGDQGPTPTGETSSVRTYLLTEVADWMTAPPSAPIAQIAVDLPCGSTAICGSPRLFVQREISVGRDQAPPGGCFAAWMAKLGPGRVS